MNKRPITLEIGTIVKIKYNKIMNEKPSWYLVVITELKSDDSFLYRGNILESKNEKYRLLSFFQFQIIKNFGIISFDELCEKYPEYLI